MSERLIPPEGGAVVRMYRIGHGDCFLIAFAGSDPAKPCYFLIDCGYKPGSPGKLAKPTKAKEIAENIRLATDGHIDVAVFTHEHQDHVNGVTAANFAGLTIGQAWFAWTEDPEDDLANDLRRQYKDKLLGLLAARNRLAADGNNDQVQRLDDFLAFEFGGVDDADFDAHAITNMLGAAGDAAQSMNKKSLKIIKDLANSNQGVRFLRPHQTILQAPGASDVRVFVLGPPRDEELLKDLDPEGAEEFHGLSLASASAGNFFAAAARADGGAIASPFARRFCVAKDAMLTDLKYGSFFTQYYGLGAVPFPPPLPPSAQDEDAIARDEDAIQDDEMWRRIDCEWLYSAEQLALDMNDYTNNQAWCSRLSWARAARCCCSPPTRSVAIGSRERGGNGATGAKRSRLGTCSAARCFTRSDTIAATTPLSTAGPATPTPISAGWPKASTRASSRR